MMALKVLSVEPTPNPNAKKFVIDRRISETPLSYRTSEAAAKDPLAAKLMALPGVVGLLFLHDFVTVSKSSEARWADISAKAKRIMASVD
jgi:hypothetical protein